MINDALKKQIRKEAGNRCGYCLSLQKYVLGKLEIDHIIPQAKGGTDNPDNLWLACRLCNGYKEIQQRGWTRRRRFAVPHVQTTALDPNTGKTSQLFNPRKQKWSRHFQWNSNGTQIEGKTATGRATVNAKKLNNFIAVTVREQWVQAGWHPPSN
ncbi:MAG: HNH endonuclease signature motif containing protein [Pleurocapsa sp. MO_226.B13]|nr:HNH endonuclease signature motif containing protein [Pleurocapsa sp. MO_226.B13]